MSFLERFRRNKPALMSYPNSITHIDVPLLKVYMAEDLVIINIDASSAQVLIDAAQHSIPTRLSGPQGRPLSLIPTAHSITPPTLDPNLGWLLPLPPAVSAEILASGLPAGDTELSSINVAFVVEALK